MLEFWNQTETCAYYFIISKQQTAVAAICYRSATEIVS